jgi:hypothetical protein
MKNKMNKIKRFFDKAIGKEEKIMEVELWCVGEEGINFDEKRAWEIIKEIYTEVLKTDDNWHFFYENAYNIIRCSKSFYPEVIEKLKQLDVYYKEKGEWIDEQTATRKYQHIYKSLFHYFTLMALEEYDWSEIHSIYDRVSHCFLNHQFYVLEDYRKKYGRQWESNVMSSVLIDRSSYTGILYERGHDTHRSTIYDTSEKSFKGQVKEKFEEEEKE